MSQRGPGARPPLACDGSLPPPLEETPTGRGAWQRGMPLGVPRPRPSQSPTGCTDTPSRVARRVHAGSSGGPAVREALACPTVLTHARRGRPKTDGNGPCRTTGVPVALRLARHVRVPAPVLDQFVPLPGPIRPRPRLERLLDRGTCPSRQAAFRSPLVAYRRGRPIQMDSVKTSV
jgi:hypothetical protein